jgi:hypothetical protein
LRLGERVDLAVVVASFLRAELASDRFGGELRAALARAGADETLVTEADLDDPDANERRRAVLGDYRGNYLGQALDDLTWRRVELEAPEVLEIRFIAWDYWLEITGGSRLPADAAARLRVEGERPEPRSVSEPLIVVRAGAGERLVVVEGHVRLTALAMSPETIPAHVEILLGEGESVRGWGNY